MRNIFIIDSVGGTYPLCECGKDAMFLLNISNNENPHHICEECLGEIARRIIDALVRIK